MFPCFTKGFNSRSALFCWGLFSVCMPFRIGTEYKTRFCLFCMALFLSWWFNLNEPPPVVVLFTGTFITWNLSIKLKVIDMAHRGLVSFCLEALKCYNTLKKWCQGNKTLLKQHTNPHSTKPLLFNFIHLLETPWQRPSARALHTELFGGEKKKKKLYWITEYYLEYS